MIDRCGRNIDYLRISVTDRCNLRCIYCMPEEGVQHVERSLILQEEEILRICRVMAELGIRKIKLTGGEPLVRPRMPLLVEKLKNMPGIPEAMRAFSLTITKRAMLSRATAGIRKGTLIVNLPGSPKAVKECLEVIIETLGHGIEILTGDAGECGR